MTKLILIAALFFHCYVGMNSTPVSLDKDYLFEGDIKLKFGKSLGSNADHNKWPSGVVPYTFDSTISSTDQSLIRTSMDMITQKTSSCITFVARTTQSDYITIKALDGCYSYLGKIGGAQDVSLGSGCMYKGTIVHELCHALGFMHEQNRPDRDTYVRINTANIQDGQADQFTKYTESVSSYFNTPYDYASIMHYSADAFSKNGLDTITPLQAGVVLVAAYDMTDAQILTAYDVQGIRGRYQCSGSVVTTTTVASTTTIVASSTTTVASSTTTVASTTTAAPCTNLNSKCTDYLESKDTYCDPNRNFRLGDLSFRDACNNFCGVCTEPCSDKWYCYQFPDSYCSAGPEIYIVNGVPVRTECPNKCNSCTVAAPTKKIYIPIPEPKSLLKSMN